MSDPHDHERDFGKSAPESVTTETLAEAGLSAERSERRPAEPRAFDEAEAAPEDASGPIFPIDEADNLRVSWESIQASFVDEPRRAVEKADQLVAEAMQRLAETFARERADLETHWDRGDDVSTEDLRIAFRRYRAFFGRLLSA